MKSTIVIVGAASESGKAIAHRLAGKPYHLLVVDTDLESLNKLLGTIKSLNEDADVELLECETDACWESDIVLLAVSYPLQLQIAEKIKAVCTCKTVVSVGSAGNNIDELRRILPHSKLVIAFDKVESSVGEADSKISGEDENAVNLVEQLVKDAGLKPVRVELKETNSVAQ